MGVLPSLPVTRKCALWEWEAETGSQSLTCPCAPEVRLQGVLATANPAYGAR